MMTTATGLPYELRKAKDSDAPFWRAGLIRSYRLSRWAGVIPNHLVQDVLRVVLDGLEQRGMMVAIAHVPGDPDALMGAVCFEQKEGDDPVVHFVYTKGMYRRQGLARALINMVTDGKPFRYTLRTQDADHFRRPNYRATFAPEIARRRDL